MSSSRVEICKMNNNAFVLLINAIRNDEERHNLNRNRRQLRDASDPLSMPESTFRATYRLSRQVAHNLILELAPHMADIQREEIAIPKKLKILAALHFYSQGSYQKCVGHDYSAAMSQCSVSRCIKDVTATVLRTMSNLIRFPLTNEEKMREKQLFMNMTYGFPGIIGAIDCTHVAIKSPDLNNDAFPPLVFLNRKGYYSINVQIICNAKLKILAVNARFPGSVHDSAIWTTSSVKQHLLENYEAGDRTSWLVGDSGYPLEPWLITPILGQNLSPAEERYNNAHKHVRNVIERVNGVLKARFRCLLKHRVLHYDPITAANMINACCILHNYCLTQNDDVELDEVGDENEIEDNADDGGNVQNILQRGRETVQRIIRNYF